MFPAPHGRPDVFPHPEVDVGIVVRPDYVDCGTRVEGALDRDVVAGTRIDDGVLNGHDRRVWKRSQSVVYKVSHSNQERDLSFMLISLNTRERLWR